MARKRCGKRITISGADCALITVACDKEVDPKFEVKYPHTSHLARVYVQETLVQILWQENPSTNL